MNILTRNIISGVILILGSATVGTTLENLVGLCLIGWLFYVGSTAPTRTPRAPPVEM